jgi:hypothetical protein
MEGTLVDTAAGSLCQTLTGRRRAASFLNNSRGKPPVRSFVDSFHSSANLIELLDRVLLQTAELQARPTLSAGC